MPVMGIDLWDFNSGFLNLQYRHCILQNFNILACWLFKHIDSLINAHVFNDHTDFSQQSRITSFRS